jgi:hypothetical protein
MKQAIIQVLGSENANAGHGFQTDQRNTDSKRINGTRILNGSTDYDNDELLEGAA